MADNLGPYTLGQPLGTLPCGALVEAAHAARREPLALLILSEELARDQRLRGLLRLEIARAGGLRHPAIARPIEVAEHDRKLYVVYERPPGQPLSRWIDDRPALSVEAALAMIRQLAEGLDAAHGRRLAHGAIGTGAILTRSGESAALLGIGVLAATDEAGLADDCRQGLEPTFIAPEQRAGRLAVASADAFALGQLARKLLATADDRPDGDAARSVQTVLDRQASVEPSSRYRTCADFAKALADMMPSAFPGPSMPPAQTFPASTSSVTEPPPRIMSPPSRAEPQPAPIAPAERPPTIEPASGSVERAPTGASSARRRPKDRPWRQEGSSRIRTLEYTPAMRDAVDSALPAVLLHAALASGPSLFLLILAMSLDAVLLVLIAVGVGVLLRVPPAIVRAIRLSRARRNPEIQQVLGPVRAVEHHVFGTFPYPRSHRLEIGEIGGVTISGAAFGLISSVGTSMHVPLNAEGEVPAHDYVFDLPALVTYSRTGDLLLEIRRPDGELVYREPAYAGDE